MFNQVIKLKSNNFTLLVLYLQNDSTKKIKYALQKKIQESPSFFKNAPIILNISQLSCKIDWNSIKYIIQSLKLKIVGFIKCKNEKLNETVLDSGVPIFFKTNKLTNAVHIQKKKKTIDVKSSLFFKNKIIKKPIRSGQQIYSSNSNIIIINNVNEGSEILSNGNIHIYGKLKGKALAGIQGNTQCYIFCTELFAELISICGQFLLLDQIPSDLIGKSVQCYIKNGAIKLLKV
ncbi:Septum site-determining protein MinC [Buchnera aphidicola (Anoecia corni)]|uniref:Probable septum site-determining protein MinC n=1 Tax=Buchnera aphidicola (Anoecia corni) TaxID=2994477 RepID=A0AAT9IGD7_9GAMM